MKSSREYTKQEADRVRSKHGQRRIEVQNYPASDSRTLSVAEILGDKAYKTIPHYPGTAKQCVEDAFKTEKKARHLSRAKFVE